MFSSLLCVFLWSKISLEGSNLLTTLVCHSPRIQNKKWLGLWQWNEENHGYSTPHMYASLSPPISAILFFACPNQISNLGMSSYPPLYFQSIFNTPNHAAFIVLSAISTLLLTPSRVCHFGCNQMISFILHPSCWRYMLGSDSVSSGSRISWTMSDTDIELAIGSTPLEGNNISSM